MCVCKCAHVCVCVFVCVCVQLCVREIQESPQVPGREEEAHI